MSDIHGHLDEFDKMLELINFSDEDHLYIIGDIVDKGPKPIQLLQRVMKMKNVTCLLGNHEHMMYTYLRCEEDNNFWHDRGYCHNWLYGNDGERTLEAYKKLSEQEQSDIFFFLEGLIVAIPDLVVDGKHFYLVHSMPVRKIDKPITMYDTGDDLQKVKMYIWDRFDDEWNWKTIKDKTVIAGHTINRPDFRISEKKKGYYNIDCGCAMNKRLGCLRLEDMKEFYIESKKYDR